MPGVSVGNSFKYTYTLDLNMDSSQAIQPELFQTLVDQAKSIDWTQITITSVSGSAVTAQMVMRFKNGTQQSSIGVTDVATGEGNLTMFLIAANLNANNQINQGSDEKINETTTKTYPSGSRQINHESLTMDYTVSQEELSAFNLTGPLQQSNTQNIYWDRQTGSLVEMSYKMLTRSTQVNAEMNLDVMLVESNVYTVPEYPFVMIVFIGMAIATAFVSKRFVKPSTSTQIKNNVN
jgi:hypothetical protein